MPHVPPPSPPPRAGDTLDLFSSAEPRTLSVGELTRQLQGAVEPRFRNLWVAGEVANLRRQASGHLYFSLKDDEAVVSAVVWASQARRLRFDPADGQEVLAKGSVEIYPPHGKYQLVVQELEPRGEGARALQLQQLKERLQKEGLLDPARKRRLPFLPRRVGVATSPTGAALRDFLRVLSARFPNLPVLVAPCRVQGQGAAATVVAAVQALVRSGCDLVVVTRGGGSQEDLWEFNDERLARALAACPVPVVSAVGHEVDVTVADLVADVRAATPTHAAQLVAPEKAELLARVAELRARLLRAGAGGLERRRAVLRALQAELVDPGKLLSRERHRLADLDHRAGAALRERVRRGRAALRALAERLARQEPRARLRALSRRLAEARRRLDAWRAAALPGRRLALARLAARLEPANVARMLSRGFALALRAGRPVADSGAVADGEQLQVALARGWLDVTVDARDRGSDPLPGRAGEPPGPLDPRGRR